jgi:hypothetical protein
VIFLVPLMVLGFSPLLPERGRKATVNCEP